MGSALHFPSEGEIIAYLQQHPLTNDPSLTEKNIIQAAAKVFADQEKAPLSVNMLVKFMMQNLNKKLELSEKILMIIQKNLTAGLKDCANGKEIDEKDINNMECLLLMLNQKNININAKGEGGSTPLLKAVEKRNLFTAQALIDKGADVNIPNCSKNYPIMFAVYNCDIPMAEALLKAGADTKCMRNIWSFASKYRHFSEEFCLWIRESDIQDDINAEKDQVTPLARSILNANLSGVRGLLRCGADLNKLVNPRSFDRKWYGLPPAGNFSMKALAAAALAGKELMLEKYKVNSRITEEIKEEIVALKEILELLEDS